MWNRFCLSKIRRKDIPMKRALLLIWILTAAFAAQAQTRFVFEESTPEAFLIKQVTAGNSSHTQGDKKLKNLGKAYEKERKRLAKG